VVRLPDGRKVRISGCPTLTTRAEAEREERAHIERTVNPQLAAKEVPALQRFIGDHWLPVYPASVGNRPAAIREKEIHVRLHIVPTLGQLPLDQVRGEALDRFLAALSAKQLSEKTVRNVKATLRRILASAVEWEYLPALPRIAKVRVPDSTWDFFTREESDRLLVATRNDDERAVLLFALHTGARAGEQLAFEWGDIDWRSRKVVLRRSSTRGIVGPTKSGRERKVPLTAMLEQALRCIQHLRGPVVFCNLDGRPLTL
jgi:integrase